MGVALKRRPLPARPTGADHDRGGLVLLASGHFMVDMTVGGLAPLVPVFTVAFALSDLEASLILAASTLSSSAIQPLFGWVADRRPAPWFLWGGVALAAVMFALAGVVGGYPWVLACIVGSGIGVAAYHPEAARLAHRLAGERKASGVAWFMTGGNLGFAAGPLVTALFIPLLDARATVVVLIPAAVVCGVLLARRARVTLPVTPVHEARAAGGRSDVRGMTLMVSLTTLRTWTQFGLLLLVPLILTEERGWSDRQAGLAIFAFTMSMVFGTIAGAALADRIVGRRMQAWTLPLAAPLVVGVALAPTGVAVACLALCGFVTLASMSVTVVMGQAYMPHRMALAAGLMIGFASIGSAAPGVILIGAIADATSRETALLVVAAFPLVAGLLAAMLPRPRGLVAA
jgi:FSR family fosmidomycin resistance protein-like MFS transporter